jgi:predicted HTH transcriptional regulator
MCGLHGFNSPGLLEVPEAVFEELLVNALVHRDYFLSAPIRLLIFSDRIEINSPGHLPNHLDAEKIRFGVSNLRNPALASHAFHMLPYRGLGSGIPRATVAWTGIDFCDDRKMNQFVSIVGRPDIAENEIVPQPESRPESEPKTGGEPESRPESRPESEPKTEGEPESRPESEPKTAGEPESESLTDRILLLLQNNPLGKTELANAVGHRTVSGQLNKSIRALLAQNRIEMTLPNTPKSRLQKYRLVKRQT